ncbi:hypothetical protein CYLTODRAFT_440195 [Cylindrobasidium torrendii FP15055 ss-10]|uniref:Uncharacterized protein n=1 Tax=Cylindrobasidium torrendii FP15055 ss-10 TaxID=1314674 RepID=A0A0D7BTE6_9AGAR|nr:hypothetical protein CYLTODRAFT_440195 [Cylindrobasidium torrendii FP15055 ss-10]
MASSNTSFWNDGYLWRTGVMLPSERQCCHCDSQCIVEHTCLGVQGHLNRGSIMQRPVRYAHGIANVGNDSNGARIVLQGSSGNIRLLWLYRKTQRSPNDFLVVCLDIDELRRQRIGKARLAEGTPGIDGVRDPTIGLLMFNCVWLEDVIAHSSSSPTFVSIVQRANFDHVDSALLSSTTTATVALQSKASVSSFHPPSRLHRPIVMSAISAPPSPPTATNRETTKQRQHHAPSHLPHQKKLTARASKPLLHWFQRKIAGTVRSRRDSTHGADKGSNNSPIPLRQTTRSVPTQFQPSVTDASQRRTTISLNADSDSMHSMEADLASTTDDRSSVARDSMWSPTSALEADDDASMRPILPSSPPSPAPSRSSSSYLSNPHTFRSIAASTKPTTLLSIDLHGNGMAHIAQAPVTPTSYRFSHARTPSAATNPLSNGVSAVTFSALAPSASPTGERQDSLFPSVQAPLHTTHHPRNNPRPSSPPLDNASMLTLASSAYAHPSLRPGAITPGTGSAPPSALGPTDAYSQYGGSESASQFPLGDDGLDERDVDASVRALRPRSSRRGSWESEVSRWSARIQLGSPSLARERSLWTSNSVRTGALSDMEMFDNDKDGSAMGTEVELDEPVDAPEPTPKSEALAIPVIVERHESAETVRSAIELALPEDTPLPAPTPQEEKELASSL